MVRGPNVMLGYLRTSAPGVLEPLADGWYDTGDICTVDEDGFVTIRARAKRFAKIAGEMVSMPAAEALAGRLWPERAHAVVAVPDGRKGEALVLLTTQKDASTGALLAYARERGAAEIAVPRSLRWWTACRCWRPARWTIPRRPRWRWRSAPPPRVRAGATALA